MTENVVYLLKVSPSANNNKYYRMTEMDNGQFKAEYGRVSANPQTRFYNMSMWDSKYREKIKKGYVDQTRLVATVIIKSGSSTYADITNISIREIVDRLQQYSSNAIKQNYQVSSNNVTQAMIDEAQVLIDQIKQETNVDNFNKLLVDLFQTIPRKMRRVSEYLATDTGEFSRIIDNEQDLLDVMKGRVVQDNLKVDEGEETVHQQTILDALGLEMEETTPEDVKIIKKQLGGIADRYYNSWRVINKKTKKKFDDFVQQEDIKDIRLLWHGSRNQNWMSIMQTGLVLRPNAVITGKLLGHGIYFAPKARKSLGYTSLSGSYWTKGKSNSGFMTLNQVAYGKPYNVNSFENSFYKLCWEELQKVSPGSHCTHAHAGSMLRNDEIVIYKEEQVTIKYLVELR